MPPNFVRYHQSITRELHSLKDRVRDLITYGDEVKRSHWLSDGEHKESALRSTLRRFMPENLTVGRGFVVTEEGSSTQIDILVVDGNAPNLFKDGDFIIVTPDAVRGVVEVKTTLTSIRNIREAVDKLAEIVAMSRAASPHHTIWTGLFVYEGENNMENRQPELLKVFKNVFDTTEEKINCMSLGDRTFIRYWRSDEIEWGKNPPDPEGESWRSYDIADFAPTYFMSNLIASSVTSSIDRTSSAFAWFPVPGGKFFQRRWVFPIDNEEAISNESFLNQQE